MSIILLLLYACSSGGDIDSPLQNITADHVTLKLSAAPVSKIVAQFGKAVGVTMEVTNVLRNEVLLLDVKDQPAVVIMGRIADAVDGSWNWDGKVYRLTRTPDEQRRQEERERKYRLLQIQAQLDKTTNNRNDALTEADAKKIAETLSKAAAKSPYYTLGAKIDSPVNQTPARRALLRLVSTLDLSDFTLFEPGDRIVYSNEPTHMQRPLNSEVENVLTKYVAEQNAWSSAVSALNLPETRMADDPLGSRSTMSKAPDRVILVASRGNSYASVQFTLTMIADGSQVGYASIGFGPEAAQESGQSFFDTSAQAGAKITLSPQTATLVQAMKGFQNRGEGRIDPPSSQGIELLTHPETIDPLGFAASDGFFSVAEAKRRNIVATLPDELVVFNFVSAGPGQTMDGFWKMANATGELSVEDKDGWLTIKPNRPYSAGYNRLNRAALGKYLRSIVSNGRATLDEQGEFALNSSPAGYDTFGMPMGMMIDPNSTQNVDHDWTTLKLWGALTKRQKEVLIGGQKILFADLTQAQMSLVRHEAYAGRFKHLSGVVNVGSAQAYQLLAEPTECLPNDLDKNGYLSISAGGSTAILGSSTAKSVQFSYKRLMDPAEMGAALAQQDDPNSTFKPMFDRFQLVHRVTYQVDYKYSPEVSDGASLLDVETPKGSKPVPLNDLADSMKQQVLAGMEAEKARPKPAVQRPPP